MLASQTSSGSYTLSLYLGLSLRSHQGSTSSTLSDVIGEVNKIVGFPFGITASEINNERLAFRGEVL